MAKTQHSRAPQLQSMWKVAGYTETTRDAHISPTETPRVKPPSRNSVRDVGGPARRGLFVDHVQDLPPLERCSQSLRSLIKNGERVYHKPCPVALSRRLKQRRQKS